MPPLSRFVRVQVAVFALMGIFVLGVLGVYYLRVPRLVGIGQYTLYADLPTSGGLYATANVTYRGIQIGRVTSVEPTEHGALATLSIDNRYKIPVDASANVHSVSAIGEQYLDLVSTGKPQQYFRNGQTITKSTIPSDVGPALDAANQGLAVLPKEKISSLLKETSQAVGGLGPALQRLVDATTNIASDFRDNLKPVNDIVANSAPILSSQVNSGDAIERWARNLNVIGAQVAAQDPALRSGLQQAAPTLDAATTLFSNIQDALPQTLANLEIIIDMLKRYHKGVEQTLVILPQEASILESGAAEYPGEGLAPIHFTLGAPVVGIAATALSQFLVPPGAFTDLNVPPPCLTGFLPASQWRSPADTSMAPLPCGTLW